MTISLKHTYESPVADNGDADLVGPDEWNAEHTLTQATNTVLGRITAGTGATEELTATQVRTLLNVEDGATADMTAAEILAALLSVDGAASGLDADLLDGSSGADYLARANHTGTQLLATISDVTASAAEVNILDGATLSTAELNFVDGVTSAIQTQIDGKQPLDASLTAYAALVTAADKAVYYTAADTPVTYDISAFGRTLANLADETALEALLDSLPNLANIQSLAVAYADAGADALWGWDDSASTYANLSAADARTALGMSANGQSLVTAANYAAMRGLLDLEAGTDFYSIAAANAAFQPLDADLTTIAGLTATTDNFIVSVASAWASRTPAQVRTTLGLVIGTNVQAFDADLTTLSTAFTTASASGAASLDFHEDTDNGTNRVRLQGPASTADVTVTLPAATDTLVGKATTDTFTNKTFDANGTGNALSNVEVADFAASAIVTAAETIAANNNDTTIPTSAAVKAYADSVGSGSATYPPGHLYGFTLSNNGTDATNDIDITAGTARDSTDTVNITGTAMTKRLDANWAAGTGNGGRNSGAAITDTTYHMFLVSKAAGADPDYYFHTSATVATVITALQAESGGTDYIYARRVGSIVRLSGAIKAFTQRGDEFLWKVPVADVNASSMGTSAVTRTLTLPTGIQVGAVLNVGTQANGGEDSRGYLSSLDTTDTATTTAGANIGIVNNNIASVQTFHFFPHLRTNTSGQIRSRFSASSAAITLFINTVGWEDTRDRIST